MHLEYAHEILLNVLVPPLVEKSLALKVYVHESAHAKLATMHNSSIRVVLNNLTIATIKDN